MQSAANGLRPSPRHGWLAAVIPASAQRFRVRDPELAAALSAAGAVLVDNSPDVEIGTGTGLAGDAPCAIVPLRAREPTSRSRALRGAQRLGRAAVVRARTGYVKRALRRRGYASTESLDWDRGTSVRLDGEQRYDVRALAHRFPLNAVVVGRRTDELTAFEAAVEGAEQATGRECRLESLLVAASGVIVARSEEIILRVGVGPAADRLEEQRASLERLEERRPPAVIADRAPRILSQGRAGLAVWSAERRLRGTRAPVQLTDRLLADSLEFLVALHGLESDGPPRSLARDADVIASIARCPSADELRELGRDLDDRFAETPRGFGHGDFWSGNLLVEDGGLSGVVDWPSAGPGCLPVLDLLHLKATAVRELSRRDLGCVIVDDLIELMQAGGDEPIREYCRRIGLEPRPELLVDLLKAYWLQALAHELLDPDRDPHKSAQERWREVNVEYVLRAFTQLRRPLGSTRVAGSSDRFEPGRAVVLTTADELDSLEAEWTALAEQRANPFVTPDWFWAWVRNFPQRGRPFVIALRTAEGRLQGLVPFVLSAGKGVPTLSFGGSEFGDYFHPAAAEADEAVTARAAAAALAEHRRAWAVLVADYVDDDSAWLGALRANGTMPLHVVRYHAQESVYRSVALSGLDWDGYLAGRSGNFRSQLGRKQRALARNHEFAYRRADSASLGADMATLFDLHGRRWAGRPTAVFSTAAARSFHLAFARSALARGWLRLWLLEVDGAPIAAWYGWRLADRYLYYQAGFDPDWGRYSPGLLLLAHTVRSSIEEGAARYDMLLGDEPYKARFADVERTAQTLVMTRPTHPARALVATDIALRRAARRLPAGTSRSLRAVLGPALKRWPIETAP